MNSLLINVACFLTPILGAVKFTLVGELSLAEFALAVICLVSLLGRQKPVYHEELRVFYRLGAFWLLAQIASDIYRNSEFVDYSRGIVKIATLLIALRGYASLISNSSTRLYFALAGIYCGPLVSYLIYSTDLPLYKFIFGALISAASFLFYGAIRNQVGPIALVLPFSAGLVALFANSRALAGITISAALLCLLTRRNAQDQSISRASYVGKVVLWASLSFLIVGLYNGLAQYGILNDDAVEKYEAQLNEKGKFTILDGRNELYFVGPKLLASPLIGWGSWAKDPNYVGERAEAIGLDPARVMGETGGLIPTHSHIFGSWLEAGILGAIFWVAILRYLFICIVSKRIFLFGPGSGIIVFALLGFCWDIFFSPFGGERRTNNGLLIVLVLASFNATRFVVSPGAPKRNRPHFLRVSVPVVRS